MRAGYNYTNGIYLVFYDIFCDTLEGIGPEKVFPDALDYVINAVLLPDDLTLAGRNRLFETFSPIDANSLFHEERVPQWWWGEHRNAILKMKLIQMGLLTK